MGFFKSLRQLQRQSADIQRDWDPAAQMRAGMAQMQAATASLAQQNATAHLAHTGLPGSGMVTAVRDSGTRMNGQPLVTLDLLVTVPGRPPYPVTVQCVVPLIGLPRLAPGQDLQVRVDRARPESVAVIWA
ncbi:hypothetical protein EDD29_3678 [Actinocorallia herbida]|uniref:Uncharacterized protein n=1 Tax=Actinocorallia herbida TaxID=58109 RepID=A0A3N1CXZ2_9ACTN|nr:hypothetical protein [Actinocorallia herbida]ROO86115.1 hypothetical protein EDD29_3678 [Actinocorallia herbida]